LIFDKDDMLMAKFVTAASNLRSHIFKIPFQTEYNTQQMAGNIVPAITSTNAMVAAFQLTECMKFMMNTLFEEYGKKKGLKAENKELYVSNLTTKVLDAKLGKAKPECLACNEALMPLLIYADTANFTIGDLIDKVYNPASEEFDFEIYSGNVLVFEWNQYLEDDEIEAAKKKRNQNLKDAFKQEEILLKFQEDKHMMKILIVDKPEIPPHEFEHSKKSDPSKKRKILIEKEVFGDTYKNEEEEKRAQENKMQIEGEEHAKDKNGAMIIDDDDDDVVEEQPSTEVTSQNKPQNAKSNAIDIESDDDLMVVEAPTKKPTSEDNGEANPLKRTRDQMEGNGHHNGLEPTLKQTK